MLDALTVTGHYYEPQTMNHAIQPQTEQALYVALESKHGTLIGGDALRKELGYSSGGAFRRAWERNLLPIRVFKIPRRRGLFAFTRDLARWFASLCSNDPPHGNKEV